MDGAVEVGRGVGVAWIGAADDAVAATTGITAVAAIAGLVPAVRSEQRFAAAYEDEAGQGEPEHGRSATQNHHSPPRNVGTVVTWFLPGTLTYDSRRNVSCGVAR